MRQEVRCVLWGESPHRVRLSQPPVPSVAYVGGGIDPQWAMAEQSIRGVHREACRPQGRPYSPKPNAASSNSTKRSATVSSRWKPKLRNRVLRRACSGVGRRDSGGAAVVLIGRGMYAETHRELGRPRWFPNKERRAGPLRVGKPSRNGEVTDDRWGVGLPHSTLRTGEPSTWGRR